MTKNFTDTVAGSSGVVDKPLGLAESTADENVLWEGFDIALSRMSLLQGVERQIAFAQESISTSWKADSADKLPTRVNEDVACVVALLKRHGYHEVSVVVGINTALAARGELGGFYEKPDPSDPRWSARIQFDRDESPSPTSG